MQNEEEVSDNQTQEYKWRVHYFRGHEFNAVYLDTENNNCEFCQRRLGADGRQCFQCRLCRMVLHKKCYTKSRPCNSVDAFTVNDPIDQSMLFKDTKLLHAISSGSTDETFSEDFSNELVKVQKGEIVSPLDDYVIDSTILGQGQFGVVQKGRYKHDPNEMIAIKIIDKRRLFNRMHKKKSAEKLSILKRELDILQKLDHEGIIRMHHYIETAQETMVIMDLASNGDLLGYVMENTKLTEDIAKPLIKQVTVALKYLHDNNVIHRDLKPENLLLFPGPSPDRMVVKIADFGFAT